MWNEFHYPVRNVFNDMWVRKYFHPAKPMSQSKRRRPLANLTRFYIASSDITKISLWITFTAEIWLRPSLLYTMDQIISVPFVIYFVRRKFHSHKFFLQYRYFFKQISKQKILLLKIYLFQSRVNRYLSYIYSYVYS